MKQRFLCLTSDIDNTQGKQFFIGNTPAKTPILVVSKKPSYYAYINACPHQNIPLDWGNEQFLDNEGELIVCASHGANFLIESGQCVSGPCVGKALTPVEITVENDAIYLRNSR